VTEGEAKWYDDLARLVKGDPWAVGDLLLERFPAEQYPATSAPSGLTRQLERLAAEVERHTGTSIKPRVMANYRSTALAWPPTDRSVGATYRPHEMLNGKPDRREQLDRLIKRAQREGAERLTERHVKRYRAEGQRPRQVEPPTLLDTLDKAARRFLRAERGVIVTRPDWWNVDRLTDADRSDLADWLEATAKDIRG